MRRLKKEDIFFNQFEVKSNSLLRIDSEWFNSHFIDYRIINICLSFHIKSKNGSVSFGKKITTFIRMKV
jgi:hypothetical protein